MNNLQGGTSAGAQTNSNLHHKGSVVNQQQSRNTNIPAPRRGTTSAVLQNNGGIAY